MPRGIENHGERLVPGESHNRQEAVRHKSSYLFFRDVIAADADRLGRREVRILDLGCGVGHGSSTLAEIDGARIVGIDAAADAIDYARRYYAAPNIAYTVATADAYLAGAQPFDYIVSRHVLEHIPDGVQLVLKFTWTRRLMVNVPYLEPVHDADQRVRNPHHELNNISEADFAAYPRPEFFYEDLDGVTSATPEAANSIICVSSAPELDPVASLLAFPRPAWTPNRLEELALGTIAERAAIERMRPAIDAVRRLTRLFSRA